MPKIPKKTIDKTNNDKQNTIEKMDVENRDIGNNEVVVMTAAMHDTNTLNNNLPPFPITFGDWAMEMEMQAPQGLYSGPNYKAQQAQAQQMQAPQPQAPQIQTTQPQAPQPQVPQPQGPQPQGQQPLAPQPQAPQLQAPQTHPQQSQASQPQTQQPPAPQPPAPQPQAPQPQASQPQASHPQAQPAQAPRPQGYQGPRYAYHGPQPHPQGAYHQNHRGYRGNRAPRGNRGHWGHPYRGAHRDVGYYRNILNYDKVTAAIRESDDFGRTNTLTPEAERRMDYSTYAKWLDRRTRMDRSTMKIVENNGSGDLPEDRFLTDQRQLNKLDTTVTETVFKDFNNQRDQSGFNFMNSYYSVLKVPFTKEIENNKNCICGQQSIGTLRQTVGHLGTHSHMHMGRVRCILCLTNGGDPKIFDTPDALYRHITNVHERTLFSTHVQTNFPTPNGADLFLLGYGQLLISYTLGELAREGNLSNKFWESG